MNLAILPFWSFLAFSLIIAGAAVQDVKHLKISNYFAISLIVIFSATVAVEGFQADWWENFVVFASFLAVGFGLFRAGVFGGGDIKLLAATSLWFDIDEAAYLLVAVACAGGVVALIFILLRRIVPLSERVRGNWLALRKNGPVPYGLAIAVGSVWSLFDLTDIASRSF